MEFLPVHNELNISLLENIFISMTNSYKLFWFNSIFKEIIKGKRIIKFKEAVIGMICDSWYPIFAYNLNFGSQDQLQKIVIDINKEYVKKESINKNDLYEMLLKNNNSNFEKKVLLLARYVPYRLLTPFYEEKLRRVKDYDKNSIIEKLTENDKKVLYRISSEKKEVYINEMWFDYIYKNQNIIRGWLNYKIIEFLQARNPNVPAIINKLNPPIKRDLNLAKKYWNEIISRTNIADIYSDLQFTKENKKIYGGISIDHFIPWTYIGHDKLWNLTPTFEKINSSKNNKLPDLKEYMDKFLDIQYIGVNCIKDVPKNEKYLDDFLDIDKDLNIREINSITGAINEKEFKKGLFKVINPLYQLAYNQGFRIWHYEEEFINFKEIDVNQIKLK